MKLKRISLILFCFYLVFFANAQEPFSCDGTVYFSENKKLFSLNFNWEQGVVNRTSFPGSLLFSEVGALGYNKMDNFIYGIAIENDLSILVKIDNNGDAHILDTLAIDHTEWIGSAGDVTSEGELIFYLVKPNLPLPGIASSAIGKINLISPGYDLTILPLESQIGENSLLIKDIAFDPVTDSLYSYTQGPSAFSPERRLLLIDINTPRIDDTTFPAEPNQIGWVNPFFDTFGSLWGFSYYFMFRIDKNSSLIETKEGSLDFYAYNVCSCPYTLEMQKTVSQDTVYPCSEVYYTFKIGNLAKDLQEQINFRDSFPEGFEILEVIYNPYGGTIGGVGGHELTISNMNIPFGVDSMIVKVLVPEDGEGVYLNQASLSNIDLSAGNNTANVVLSDYPGTLERRDATPLVIKSLEINLEDNILELCQDSTIIFDPLPEVEDLKFVWNTGSTASTLNITTAGIYSLTVTLNCLSDSATFEVLTSDLSVELEGNEEIIYGDLFEIEALVQSMTPILSYLWQTPDTIVCSDCPNIEIVPQKSGLIELTVNNEAGCFASDSKFILVERPVYIPNVFSPNYDGINDVFYIQTKHPIQIKKWQIFNRWGDLVFAKSNIYTNDQNEGWDGRFKGEPLEKGIYIWQLELEYLNGDSVFLGGDVLILSD
jgi:gliding motility-associated-like protein